MPLSPPAAVDVVHAQGSTFTWGTMSFLITSVQVSNSINSEIDITSMSSEVVADSANTNRRLIVQDFDSCFAGVGGAEFSVEFFADSSMAGTNYLDFVGNKKPLDFRIPQGLAISGTAVLTQIQFGVSTGEYVKGSATFKLSGS